MMVMMALQIMMMLMMMHDDIYLRCTATAVRGSGFVEMVSLSIRAYLYSWKIPWKNYSTDDCQKSFY